MREVEGGVVFTVKIVPGSSWTGVSGLLDGMVKIKVSAPPEKGKANRCLVKFLAKQIGVKKNVVSIISGETNPVKDVQVLGVSAAALSQKLGLEK
ncbi:MAG: YggU family protein [Planctomycetota bacterium]|nr:MAG: YggU family protein [Planctomycetota bacterium]